MHKDVPRVMMLTKYNMMCQGHLRWTDGLKTEAQDRTYRGAYHYSYFLILWSYLWPPGAWLCLIPMGADALIGDIGLCSWGDFGGDIGRVGDWGLGDGDRGGGATVISKPPFKSPFWSGKGIRGSRWWNSTRGAPSFCPSLSTVYIKCSSVLGFNSYFFFTLFLRAFMPSSMEPFILALCMWKRSKNQRHPEI
jgi:hypothetical protein